MKRTWMPALAAVVLVAGCGGQHLLQPGEPKVARYMAGTLFPMRYGESVRVEDSAGNWVCTIRMDSVDEDRVPLERCPHTDPVPPAGKARVFFTVMTAGDTISTNLAIPGCGPFLKMPEDWECEICDFFEGRWRGEQRRDTLGLRLCLLWLDPVRTLRDIQPQDYEATLCVRRW